jgi:hypothetical protein
MAILNNSNAISSGGYDINNSLRFRASASAYLSRTPASAGNLQKWTLSTWFKLSDISVNRQLLSGGTATSDQIWFSQATQTFNVYINGANYFTTNAVFRDPSAWYHIVVLYDSANATASNRIIVYVNGVAQTSSSGTIAQNTNSKINSASNHTLGRYAASAAEYIDGYMAETNFIDGQALTPSSFGETDTTTGSWKPKAYTGTYGTNGFYLKFSDIATTSGSNAGLGKDFSGNANYWTTNNISVTAGTTYDAMIDSPTLTSATVANYCVMNPLWKGSTISIVDGNLKVTESSSSGSGANSTISVSSGKYYWEVTVLGVEGGNSYPRIGVGANIEQTPGNTFLTALGWRPDGTVSAGGSSYITVNGSPGGTTFTTNDIIQVALDMDNNKVWLGKNNTWLASGNPATSANATATITAGTLMVATTGIYTSSSIVAFNFGQRPFSYTPPTGFVRLNTYNLPDSTIKKGNTVMDATLWTGTGVSNVIVNQAQFKPDFVWAKSRSTAYDNVLDDSVRGVGLTLISNTTGAEVNEGSAGLTAFNSNGFTIGGASGGWNNSGSTYVGWQWQAGQGSTSSNTSGSITSTVSVNTTAGFSVVTFTNPASGNWTIGHGLGVAPSFIITKSRSAGGWIIYHSALGNTKWLEFTTAAAQTGTSFPFNSVSPTSTLITYGNATSWGASATQVAYCWAEIAGFSKFGSFTANNSSDGNFIYLGFRPRWIMCKQTSGAGGAWFILDTARNTFNVMNNILDANSSGAERNDNIWDATANGMKLRIALSGDFIYAAFAENPFKNSLAR